MPGQPILRSGIDLVDIQRIEALNPAIRARFLQRVFTGAELGITGDSAESLAGRFAAKEAVVKALGCGIGPVHWKEVEILQGSEGEPLLYLHGQAQQIAADQGLAVWSISISHTRAQAVAFAVAMGFPKP